MQKTLLHILILFVFTFALPINADSKNKETYEYLDLFGQIFDRIRSSYVDEVTDEELIEKAIDGMLTGLDPHSGYMNEDSWEEMALEEVLDGLIYTAAAILRMRDKRSSSSHP